MDPPASDMSDGASQGPPTSDILTALLSFISDHHLPPPFTSIEQMQARLIPLFALMHPDLTTEHLAATLVPFFHYPGGDRVYHQILSYASNPIALLPPCPTTIRFASFYVLGPQIAIGSFSTVHRCTHKQTGEQYVVKTIFKNRSHSHHLQREVDVLRTVNHDNIIKLVDALEDADHLFLITDFCPTSVTVCGLISYASDFTEEDARDIIYCLLLALAHLHALGVAHRDIKQENLLVDLRYWTAIASNKLVHTAELVNHLQHIDHDTKDVFDLHDSNTRSIGASMGLKLIDFGLCTNQPAATRMLGSLPFMGPELWETELPLNGPDSDMWATGALAASMVGGKEPYEVNPNITNTIEERKITLKREPVLPAFASAEALDFMRNLLKYRPEDRMSAAEALEHPWMKKKYNKRVGNFCVLRHNIKSFLGKIGI